MLHVSTALTSDTNWQPDQPAVDSSQERKKMKLKNENDAYVGYGEESEEEDWGTSGKKHGKAKAARTNGGSARAGAGASGAGRTRPTNNQLLYKAYFRWPHDSLKLQSTSSLLLETDPCPSVTSCFLQVLQVLHNAEQLRTVGAKRNVLQILSTNTRRTKVVELSSGTHRVPDELRKHYLSDGAGGQYSTNLDRNRYGNDDNYLFTVIRYDLEFLGWCPCMVDVEIIDAKAGNASTLVQCGVDACSCSNKAEHVAEARMAAAAEPAPGPSFTQQQAPEAELTHFRMAPVPMQPMQPKPPMQPMHMPLQIGMEPNSFSRLPPSAPAPAPLAPPSAAKRARRGTESPKHSNSGVSGLFDVLVMAATGEGAEGAAVAGGASEPPVNSAFHAVEPAAAALSIEPLLIGPFSAPAPPPDSTAAAAAALSALLPGARTGGLGVGSLGPSPGLGSGFQAPAAPAADGAVRRPRPPPVKSRSRLWSALSQGELDSLQNALDAYVKQEDEIVSKPFGGDTVPKPFGGESALKPFGGESASKPFGGESVPKPFGGESASKPFGGLAETLVAPGSGGGAGGSGGGGGGAEPTARTRRRKPPRGNSSFLLLAADSMGGFSGLSKLGLSLGFKETSDDNLKEEVSKPGLEGDSDEAGGENGNEEHMDKEGGSTEGAEDVETVSGQRRRHVRHVPRQFSSVNVTSRVGAAEIKRMATELEALRAENKSLKAGGPPAPGRKSCGADAGLLFSLEQELFEVKAEIDSLMKRHQASEEREAAATERVRQVEERNTALTLDLAKSRAEVNILLSKLVGVGAGSSMQQQLFGGSTPSAMAMALNSASGQRAPSEQHQNGKGMLQGGGSFDSLSAQLAQFQQQQQQQQQAAGAQAAAVAAAMHSAAMQHNASSAFSCAQLQRPSASNMSAQSNASIMALLGKNQGQGQNQVQGVLGFNSTGASTAGDPGQGHGQGLQGSSLPNAFRMPAPSLMYPGFKAGDLAVPGAGAVGGEESLEAKLSGMRGEGT